METRTDSTARFGVFVKAKREALGLSLGEFCARHELDPGHVSRLEDGLLPPPHAQDRLEAYAQFLGLQPDSDEWYTFFGLAAVATRPWPQELLKKKAMAARLLFLFQVLRGKQRGPVNLTSPASVAAIGGKRLSSHRTGLRRQAVVWAGVALVVAAAVALTHAVFFGHTAFAITEAVTCQDIDTDRQPVKVTSVFPKGTERVHCWFAWKGASPKLEMTGQWYYATGGFRILDLHVTLTRAADHGVLSLQMPPGKTLPPGSYRLDLTVKGKTAKTIPFTVAALP